MSYFRFGAMVATSTVVMFGLMWLNTYALDHVMFSQTRIWMALLMGATMAFIYAAVYVEHVQKLAGKSCDSDRRGRRVGDIAMAGTRPRNCERRSLHASMIPHHSIAVLTSTRAHIRDPRVRQLANNIIEAQIREIAQMKR